MPDREPDRSDPELPSIWRYMGLDQFTCPPAPAEETLRKGLVGLAGKFRRWFPQKDGQQDGQEDGQSELKRLPDDLYAQIAAELDWTEAGAVLATTLRERPLSKMQVVVSAPGGGGATEALSQWATTQGLTLIAPPQPEEIFAGGEGWLQQLVNQHKSATLVIPHLERCYLRHHRGLTLMRRLLGWLVSQQPRCVLGCSSWAWAYLGKSLGVDSLLPIPWILEPLDQQRLQRLFSDLTVRGKAALAALGAQPVQNLPVPPSPSDQK